MRYQQAQSRALAPCTTSPIWGSPLGMNLAAEVAKEDDNVPELRRTAEVRQGRGRRDDRRTLLRPPGDAALHRPGLLVRPVDLDEGLGFDGSSIRGFQAIHQSDMSLYPDPTTAYIDQFRVAKTW